MKTFILSLLCISGSALSLQAQIAIAPEIGLNMANMALKTNGGTVRTSLRKGLAIGASADYRFTDRLSLQPALYYLKAGCNVVNVGSFSLNTIQVPVNVEYKSGKTGPRLFIGAGPYIAYNISGTSVSHDSSSTLHIGSGKRDNIKAMDWGLGFHAGVLLSNNFFIRIRYQLGIADMGPSGSTLATTKTYAIGTTIGYYFTRERAKGGKDKKKK